MKKIFLLILFPVYSFAQQWYPMGMIDTSGNSNGTKAIGAISFYNNKITIAGNFKKEGTQILNGEA